LRPGADCIGDGHAGFLEASQFAHAAAYVAAADADS
jgi:hypothetical protein